ncbi:MAG TPA: ferric reductase-like transmembrane domain-containing protein [Alphaproteobacteria bacterium]|jgi:predicted ferric reductase
MSAPVPTSAAAGHASTRGGFPPALLIVMYLAVGSFPLFLAWHQNGPTAGPWRALSNALAMVGFALLTVQFVISGRMRWVSGRVGIDRLMRFHQYAARGITVALLVHPFLYVMPNLFQDGPVDAAAALADMLVNPAFTSGLTAWALLVAVMALALLRDWLPIRYEAWRISHGIGAAAILCSGLHHAITVGSYSEDLTLAQLWIMMAALSLASLGYLYIGRPWQLGQRPFYISKIARVGDRLWSVTLWPAKQHPVGMLAAAAKPRITPPIAYEAGQFAWVTLGGSPFIMADHPFSIVSSPTEGAKLSFLIEEAGDFTKVIGALPVNSRAYVDGPFGRFTLSEGVAAAGGDAKVAGIAYVAGGVGIAPILGLLRHRRAVQETRPLRLLAGNRAANQIVYGDEMEEWTQAMDFRATHVLAQPPIDWSGGVGEIDEAMVADWIDWPHPERWLYFVSGSRAMRAAAERALRARCVPLARIIDEAVGYE